MKFICFLSIILFVSITKWVSASIPQPKGWWKFDDTTSLLKAESGFAATLQLYGTDEAAEAETGNGALKWALELENTSLMNSNGGGNLDTLIFLQYYIK
jgi:hypothetical protein